jgi:hypothetical protein
MLERYKSPSIDQIPAEMIQAGGQTRSETRKLINSLWNKEEMAKQFKRVFYYTNL